MADEMPNQNTVSKENINTQPATLQLQQFLPYRLFVLANRISSSLADHYEEQFKITRSEWRVLAVLGEQADLSAAQVAERTAMDKVAVSRAVSKLLSTELVQRQFAESDRRRSVLRLSERGKVVYGKIAPIAIEYEQKILDQLHQNEIELLRNLLTKLDGLHLDF